MLPQSAALQVRKRTISAAICDSCNIHEPLEPAIPQLFGIPETLSFWVLPTALLWPHHGGL